MASYILEGSSFTRSQLLTHSINHNNMVAVDENCVTREIAHSSEAVHQLLSLTTEVSEMTTLTQGHITFQHQYLGRSPFSAVGAVSFGRAIENGPSH